MTVIELFRIEDWTDKPNVRGRPRLVTVQVIEGPLGYTCLDRRTGQPSDDFLARIAKGNMRDHYLTPAEAWTSYRDKLAREIAEAKAIILRNEAILELCE